MCRLNAVVARCQCRVARGEVNRFVDSSPTAGCRRTPRGPKRDGKDDQDRRNRVAARCGHAGEPGESGGRSLLRAPPKLKDLPPRPEDGAWPWLMEGLRVRLTKARDVGRDERDGHRFANCQWRHAQAPDGAIHSDAYTDLGDREDRPP